MDAFSVSLVRGLCEPKMKKRRLCLIVGIFAFFQFLMPMLGWVCVHTLASQFAAFQKFIPYIALALLLFIGGNLLIEGIKAPKEGETCPLKPVSFGAYIEEGAAELLAELAEGKRALAIGPGLGTDEGTWRAILPLIEGDMPKVIDADALYAVKTLVFDEKKVTMAELKKALMFNYGKGLDDASVADIAMRIIGSLKEQGVNVGTEAIAGIVAQVKSMDIPEADKKRYGEILELINQVPKFGNDDPTVDAFARDVAYTYTRPLLKYKNPRGGMYQAGLYPVSANVPLGAQTGATPDGRLAHTPVADGVSPSAGKDVNGPTAAANSVSRLDHGIASNGTLFNQKFHPSALSGEKGLDNFVSLIRSYFDQKGSHMQFNVVDRETLLDAQKNPEKYKHLVVRVAGYSALFTTLSKSLQDDIIRRTEQGF